MPVLTNEQSIQVYGAGHWTTSTATETAVEFFSEARDFIDRVRSCTLGQTKRQYYFRVPRQGRARARISRKRSTHNHVHIQNGVREARWRRRRGWFFVLFLRRHTHKVKRVRVERVLCVGCGSLILSGQDTGSHSRQRPRGSSGGGDDYNTDPSTDGHNRLLSRLSIVVIQIIFF